MFDVENVLSLLRTGIRWVMGYRVEVFHAGLVDSANLQNIGIEPFCG